MKRVWQCESCGGTSTVVMPWECVGCGNETCDRCFDSFAHCKTCASGRSDEELRLNANQHGYDYDPISPPKAATEE